MAPSSCAYIHLDRLDHNMALLRELAGGRPLWPAIKANAYGHGASIVARRLTALGYDTLCVAHVAEAIALKEAGIKAKFIVMSAALPEQAEEMVAYGIEAAVCTRDTVDALAKQAEKAARRAIVHLLVDTGMGRVGIRPDEVAAFLEYCGTLPPLKVRGLMSHFPRADEADKAYSLAQLDRFRGVVAAARQHGIEIAHIANSAAIFDLPGAVLDAARPGISIYGLAPSAQVANPRVAELRPVLEWKTRISFLKDVPSGTGLSYGHAFVTNRNSLVATVTAGYGDGLNRNLSNRMDILIQGRRCPQVGRITMDQTLVDVTALRGRVALGDEAVLIGRQGDVEITADELARTLGTINYEIVTAIAERVPRIPVPA